MREYTWMSSAFLLGNRVYRGWALKRKPAYISLDYQDASFTLIVAFSEYNFYGIMLNQSSNDSKIILHFIANLFGARSTYFK